MSKKNVLELIMTICEQHQILFSTKTNIIELQSVFNSCVSTITGVCSGAIMADYTEIKTDEDSYLEVVK